MLYIGSLSEAINNTVSVTISNTIIHDVTINLGSTLIYAPSSLALDNAILGSNVVLTTDAAKPLVNLILSGTSSRFDGHISGNGDLTVSGDLRGTGTITIERGGEVTLGAVGADETIRFADNNGTLILTDPKNFAGTIANFQEGDRILIDDEALGYVKSATYDDGMLKIWGEDDHNPVLLASVDLQFAGSAVGFFVEKQPDGTFALATSDQHLTWNGSSGDWYDAANWSGHAAPLGGDDVYIYGGNVTISDAGFAQYGALDFENVWLGNPGGSTPISLTLPQNYALGNDLTINVTGSISGGSHPYTTLIAPGATVMSGDLYVNSIGGKLEIKITPDANGKAGVFTIVNNDSHDYNSQAFFNGSVFVGQDSGLLVTGGTLVNQDHLYINGNAVLDGTTTLDGSGTMVVQSGGNLEIDGAATLTANIQFNQEEGTSAGSLTIGALSQFDAQIQLGQRGNTILVENLTATHSSYASGVLHLLDVNGNEVGTLNLSAPGTRLHPTLATDDFTITSTGGNTIITYTPKPWTIQESLPVSAVGVPGSTISFADLLMDAFGSSVPAGFEHFELKNLYTGKNELLKGLPGQYETSYWGIGDQAVDSRWLIDGQPITNPTQITAADISRVSLKIGNSMPNTAAFSVLTAGTVDDPLLYRNYNIWTTQPDVKAENFASGNITPKDIVASTNKFAEAYPLIPNEDDCNWIADNVAAAAGAVMPYANFSDVPSQNVSGGFWRVVYRGDDPADHPVQNWSTLVKPGDVVRMVWQGGEGHHTTTVTSTLDRSGYLEVYDNDNWNEADGLQHYIDHHLAKYWPETNKSYGTTVDGTTIYRLDPNHQYLINGTTFSETLQGSVYNNLIRPNGGADTITAGTGDNEIQGTTAELNGITIRDWHTGDWLDATDLTPGTATVSYNATLGLLTLQGQSNGTGGHAIGTALSATVTLAPGLEGTFVVTADRTGAGVEVRTLPASDSVSLDFKLTEATVTFANGHKFVADKDGFAHDVTGVGTIHFTDGTVVEKDGYALVDDLFYYARNLDVWAAHIDGQGVEADTHYLNGGWREHRDPNAYFSTDGYLAANPDVAAAGVDPLIHYDNGGWREGRSSGGLGLSVETFSAEAYIATYADVKAAGVDPLAHYLAADLTEGRIAFAGQVSATQIGDFDAAYYLAQYPDVAAAAQGTGINPVSFALTHYLEGGLLQGGNPNAYFSPQYYLSHNPQVALSGLNPLLHYQTVGWHQGLDPGPNFSTDGYLAAHPDVAAANIDPLQYFLQHQA